MKRYIIALLVLSTACSESSQENKDSIVKKTQNTGHRNNNTTETVSELSDSIPSDTSDISVEELAPNPELIADLSESLPEEVIAVEKESEEPVVHIKSEKTVEPAEPEPKDAAHCGRSCICEDH